MTARVPTGAPRGRPKGCVKSGGRVAGKSLDKTERVKITSEMAGSILLVFERLGGVDFLYRWAKKNETAYVTNCLARLMPPMPKDGDTDTVNQTINFNSLDLFEASRRVAFALNAGLYAQRELAPQEASQRWQAPADLPVGSSLSGADLVEQEAPPHRKEDLM